MLKLERHPPKKIQSSHLKFERAQIHFFTVVFTAVVVALAEGP